MQVLNLKLQKILFEKKVKNRNPSLHKNDQQQNPPFIPLNPSAYITKCKPTRQDS